MDYKHRVAKLEESFHDFGNRVEVAARYYGVADWKTGVRSFHDIAGLPLFQVSSALLSLKQGEQRHDSGDLLGKAEKRIGTLRDYFALLGKYQAYGALELADNPDEKTFGAFPDLRKLRTGKGKLDIPKYVKGSTLRLSGNSMDINGRGQPEFHDFVQLFSAGDAITDYIFDALTITRLRGLSHWNAFLHVRAKKLLGKEFPAL